MKKLVRRIRKHSDGFLTWVQIRQSNVFIEAVNGLFQATKRKARGYQRLTTIHTALFLLASKLDRRKRDPHATKLRPT